MASSCSREYPSILFEACEWGPRTFTGRSYAPRESASTPDVWRWNANEARCQAGDPHGEEGGKTKDGVEHLVGIGAVVGVEIRPDCVIERKKKERENRAAEPCEPRTEELERGFRVLRTEPVLFVWEIDEFGWETLKDARHAKCEDRGHHDGADEECEEHRFGLPAVGDAATVEMRRDLVGQLRVARRKINSRENREHDENAFGQS